MPAPSDWIGSIRSVSFRARPRGTPQGSVISPLLFNLALLQLPPLLQQIPHIQHALYAGDLTIWTTGGSIGEQQDALQEAINTTDNYLTARGLNCAPEKSALLVLQKRTQGRKRQPLPDPQLSLHGAPILTTPTIRVLGQNFEKKKKNRQKLTKMIGQNKKMHLMHLPSRKKPNELMKRPAKKV